MKNFSKILVLGGLILSVGLTSCKKDDASPSKTELITAKSWMQTKVELSYGGTTVDVSDIYLEDCRKDDVTTFAKDGTYKITIGTDDCDGDENNETGTWSFTSNETMVHITTDSDTFDGKIVSITSTTLKVSIDIDDYDANGDGKPDGTAVLIYTFTGK